MQEYNLSIRKKIVFTVIILCALFIVMELSARTYHCIRHRDVAGFFYGQRFIDDMMERIKSHKAPNPYRYASLEKMADEAFRERNTRDIPLETIEPVKKIFFGYPAYINKFDLRNRDIELKKDANATRIIAIGGSFVACIGVADTETWEYLFRLRPADPEELAIWLLGGDDKCST